MGGVLSICAGAVVDLVVSTVAVDLVADLVEVFSVGRLDGGGTVDLCGNGGGFGC